MLNRRDPEITFRRFRRTYLFNTPKIMTWVVLAVLVLYGISALVFVIAESAHNSGAENREAILKEFKSYGSEAKDLSSATRHYRENLANDDVQTVQHFPSKYDFVTDQKQLLKIAKTGIPLNLNTKRMHWRDFTGAFPSERDQALWFLLIYGNVCLFAYWFFTHRRRESLVDLPWKKLWSWCFIIITIAPFGWLIYGIATVVHKNHARRGRFREPTTRNPKTGEYQDLRDKASGNYVQLRTREVAIQHREAIKALKEKLRETQNNSRQLASTLQQQQREINKIRANVRTSEEHLEELDSFMVGEDEAKTEFDKIMLLPGVVAALPTEDGFSVIVEARYRYLDKVYDLGDWQIQITGNTDGYFVCRRLRSGVMPGWTPSGRAFGAHPDYSLEWGTAFCFRDRETIIQEHIRRGQYPEALSIIVNTINSVNEADVPKIPAAFQEVT